MARESNKGKGLALLACPVAVLALECGAVLLALDRVQAQQFATAVPAQNSEGQRNPGISPPFGVLSRDRRRGEGATALRRMLDGLQKDKKGPLILVTSTGRAWRKRYFADRWQQACEAAGISDLHFHDLRGTAIMMLTEAGATVPEIAAVTGHSLSHASRILEVYLSRTRSLADAAIIKLDERRNRP